MNFVKLNGGTGAVLVALAVLAASSQAARAETIFLKCHRINVSHEESTTLTIDLAKNTS